MHHICENLYKRNTSYCHQPGFFDDLCRRNKFHISKTVRLGLDVASKFLEDPNVKIIYVARDPRGNNKLRFLLICTNRHVGRGKAGWGSDQICQSFLFFLQKIHVDYIYQTSISSHQTLKALL